MEIPADGPRAHIQLPSGRPSGRRSHWLALALVLAVGSWAGCAAPTTPEKTAAAPKVADMNILQKGMARPDVIKAFGQPATATTEVAGNRVDIFIFVQKFQPGLHPPQPIEPGQEDARMNEIMIEKLTGVSTRSMLDGQTLTVQVNYDAAGAIEDTHVLDMTK